jgi:hypothetical protein
VTDCPPNRIGFIAHHATVIVTKGKSFRMRKKRSEEAEQTETGNGRLPTTKKKS